MRIPPRFMVSGIDNPPQYGVTLYGYFIQVDWQKGMNASNAFDVSAYMQAKAVAVGLSVTETMQAFMAAGVDSDVVAGVLFATKRLAERSLHQDTLTTGRR